MYKVKKSVQKTFEDFNQSGGMKLNVLFGTGLSCFVFYFEDAPDGVASFDLVEVQDDAA